MIQMILDLRPYSQKATKWLILNLITALIGNILILINPLLIGFVVNRVVGPNNVDQEYVFKMLSLIALFYLAGTTLLWISQFCSHNYSTIVIKNLRNKAFNIITHTPLSYLDTNQTGDIMMRFSQDSDLVFDALSNFFMQFFQGATTIIISLGLMIYLNIYLTLVILATIPIILIYSKLTRKKASERFVKVQKLTGKLTSTAQEYISEKKLILAYNYEEEAKKEFDQINEELMQVSDKAYFLASINNPTYRMFNNIAYAFLGVVALILALLNQPIEISVLTSMIMYSAMFSRPFNEFSVLTANFMAGKAGLKRLKDILDQDIEEELLPFLKENRATKGEVIFQHVDFSYQKGQNLIKDFNLEVKPGQKIAIVGPTGAGKSTMINLLMRYYDVNNGKIILDGKDIKSYNRNALRMSFGLVLQEPWLFNGTIEDNLKYGKKDATLEEIVEAAKKANCHSFISKLSQGYQTVLGDDINLSVGQKQLLTIARALVINPPILILDEATSSIDSLMEQEIQKAFLEVMKNRTSFIIAHRLKTIIDSDVIIVMNKGKIEEYGTHDVLMKKNGFYSNLYLSQFSKED
ncbi:ABC transporter, permease and ATP-binding protein [Alteracholeplasma palmae J233]|uniref:ABC transporter, permease and ATP-binding protein n=1 Tax=Alteracholeplasma palmae (strain ATCC 49389 / J233) TaxID=1318466 RepID=U4KLQ0_ALTPJ|nr:ABC transporter ATP-binding protein [Alteracholeplasma palmae]CCV64827.1 ABC transporter, permease and ATP-binding protein [Alteracholeplasma palmae J233]